MREKYTNVREATDPFDREEGDQEIDVTGTAPYRRFRSETYPNLYNPEKQEQVFKVDPHGAGPYKEKDGRQFGIIQTNINFLQFLYSVAWRTKLPLLVYGDPGVGKTSTISAFAESLASQLKNPDGQPLIYAPINSKDIFEASGEGTKDITQSEKYKTLEALYRKHKGYIDAEGKEHPGDHKTLFNYFFTYYMVASHTGPDDIMGIPKTVNVNDFFNAPYYQQMHKLWVDIMSTKEVGQDGKVQGVKGLIFFDEFNCGHEFILYQLQSVVNEKAFGGKKLSPGIAMIAAGNLHSTMEPKDLTPAQINRFLCVNAVCDVNGSMDFFRNSEVVIDEDLLYTELDPNGSIGKRVGDLIKYAKKTTELDGTTSAIGELRKSLKQNKLRLPFDKTLMSYLEALASDKDDPDLKHWMSMPDIEGGYNRGSPFPTPRSIERLATWITATKLIYNEAKKEGYFGLPDIYDVLNVLASGWCGYAWAQKFLHFVRTVDDFKSLSSIRQELSDPKRNAREKFSKIDVKAQLRNFIGSSVKAAFNEYETRSDWIQNMLQGKEPVKPKQMKYVVDFCDIMNKVFFDEAGYNGSTVMAHIKRLPAFDLAMVIGAHGRDPQTGKEKEEQTPEDTKKALKGAGRAVDEHGLCVAAFILQIVQAENRKKMKFVKPLSKEDEEILNTWDKIYSKEMKALMTKEEPGNQKLRALMALKPTGPSKQTPAQKPAAQKPAAQQPAAPKEQVKEESVQQRFPEQYKFI